MSSGFEPGSDDRIHACRLKCCCLIGCCRPADCDDAFHPALVQDFSWRDSNDEAVYQVVRVHEHASLSSNRIGEYGLYFGRGAPKAARCAASGARLRLNAFSSDVRAPSSSIETHRFIANGFDVSEPISAITFLIASGARPCAPNDPSPPKLETAAVNFCDD